jgi:hypothetical protein
MCAALSDYFSGIAAKRLSEVETTPSSSNQHEFNGINGFKEILGGEKARFPVKFIFLADNEEQTIINDGFATWYDARENHPTRTEFRLYYSDSEAIAASSANDLVIIGKTPHNSLTIIIAKNRSTSESQVLWLFGLSLVGDKFQIKDLSREVSQIEFASRQIISSLGFELEETIPDYLGIILDKFNGQFPTTKAFSEFVRTTIEKDVVESPDTALVRWMEREELLFKTLEKHLVESKFREGFGMPETIVDEFIKYSLSIHQRRKVRAGHAFENHLSFIFENHGVTFSKGPVTENNNTPDFIFPDIKSYHELQTDDDRLTMLGVKTSAKDRWRQILPEANKISQKHLITLEPSISTQQTEQMRAESVQLIIPESLFASYTASQQTHLMSLTHFIDQVQAKQRMSRN